MEDPKAQETLKRSIASFKEQEQAMYARALKAHAYDCPDPWTCTKDPCFIRTPDVVIAKSTVARKTNKERTEELKAKRKSRSKE
jgi:hypothetical protein